MKSFVKFRNTYIQANNLYIWVNEICEHFVFYTYIQYILYMYTYINIYVYILVTLKYKVPILRTDLKAKKTQNIVSVEITILVNFYYN